MKYIPFIFLSLFLINCNLDKVGLDKNFNPFDNNFDVDTNTLLEQSFIKKEYGDDSFKFSKNYNDYTLDYSFSKKTGSLQTKIIDISVDSIKIEGTKTENIDSMIKVLSHQPFDTLKLNELMKKFELFKANQNNTGVITYKNSKDQDFDLIYEYSTNEIYLRRNLIYISVKD